MDEITDRWLSISEICKPLGISSDTVYKWIEKRDASPQNWQVMEV
jgi:predicted DNA-binding transcriptional regulator AlpA